MPSPAHLPSGTLPAAATPAAGPGPVLIIHQDPGATAAIARALAAAGWFAATPGTLAAAVIFDASGHDAGTAASIALVRKSTPGAPLLFLTTREILIDLLDAGTLPGDDYLLAPFAPEDVALRLRWLTRNGSTTPRREPELTVGDLSLQPRWLHARRGNHRIPLTKTQCTILQLLMQNSGDVVSKDDIVNHLWPGNNRGGNNVELHISHLRGKINAAGPPMIHTLRSAGYLIKPAPTAPEPAASGTRNTTDTPPPGSRPP
jgi:two-component system OmpR family response regulator